MIDYSYCKIERLAVHWIGNPVNEDPLELSEHEMNLEHEDVSALVKHYFLSSFKSPEVFGLSSQSGQPEANPMWEASCRIWEEPDAFLETSKQIAEHLYESSQHANIRNGYLYVAWLKGLSWDGNDCDAIGIFKSESKENFLQLNELDDRFEFTLVEGLHPDKLDKGCLIFDLESETGFVVNVHDRNSRSAEASFWTQEFLQLRARSDDFHHTQNFLSMTKSFVTEQIEQEFEVDKTDKIDMLNRSIEYFKENDHFDESDFGRAVFGDEEVISSFAEYGQNFQEEHNMDIEMDFAISTPAVKKQSRVFKSVLKLDKNFHVYIHGNKDLIERGVDDDGRKFYKIYYNEER